jgi:hypothetical protein
MKGFLFGQAVQDKTGQRVSAYHKGPRRGKMRI